ncbi:MAG: adenylyltransferase/cytidyltransferase family protein [Candidatus Latescibacterota bacterium]|nr:adenylyltransferase/cytidyltransferase family protein [Candidatus Latescibacterota bacterium]
MNSISEKVRVLCCGTFDYLHLGHESFLRQASVLGDELYVVIARDVNVVKLKGRLPDHDEITRKTMVEDLGLAKKVVLGHKGVNLLRIVSELNPDVIALGYDQNHPSKLREKFPLIQIEKLESFEPEKFKSSVIREQYHQ